MEKTKKIKIIIGLFYAIFLGLFLFFFFSNFTIQEITSYEFIKDNRNFFLELRQKNLFLLAISFIIFTIIWVLAAGFGAPIAIISGFIFGKWFGTFFVLIGMSMDSPANRVSILLSRKTSAVPFTTNQCSDLKL